MVGVRELFSKVRTPLAIWFGNRLAVFLVAYLGLVAQPGDPRLGKFPKNLFLHTWFRWDSGWYLRIAEEGYKNNPSEIQKPMNFFPGYPLAIRWFNVFCDDMVASSLIVSNLSLLFACVLLYRYLARQYDESVATRSLVLMLCHPYAFIFSAAYTESLFLLGVAGAFYFSRSNRWLTASLFAAIAGATRLVGFLALIPVFFAYMQRRKWRITGIRPDILLLGAGLLGTGGYMLFLYLEFDEPLMFMRTQWVPGWGDRPSLSAAIDLLHRVGRLNSVLRGHFDSIYLLNGVLGVLSLGLCVVGMRRLGVAATLWAVGSMVISLRLWTAAGRYSVVVWPVFVVLALMTRKRDVAYQSILTLFCVIQSLYIYLFAHGRFLG
ncbi:MAG: mannosyltransferase family protein [Polyangiaceae bacterium]